MPGAGQGAPLHQQGYRAGGPMTTAGIGMSGQRQPYPDPRLQGTSASQMHSQQQGGQHMHAGYGQAQHQAQHMHQQPPHPPTPPSQPQHQGNKFQQANMLADARDRELAALRAQQQQQLSHHHASMHQQPHASHSAHMSAQQPGPSLTGLALHNLERHSSGSSHSQSQGTLSHTSSGAHLFAQSDTGAIPSTRSSSNDAYEEILSAAGQISPGSGGYSKPFTNNAPPVYPPHHGQQYGSQQAQQGAQLSQQSLYTQQRPASLQPAYVDQYGFDGGRSRGDSIDSRGARGGNYPPTHTGGAPLRPAMDALGHGYPAHQGYNQSPVPQYPGMATGSPRDRYAPGGFGMDSSFFDTSAGPIVSEPLVLDGPRNSSGSFHQRGSSFGSGSGIGMDRVDGASPGSSRTRVGSLMSGLREGTVELDAGNREWDLFGASNGALQPHQDFLGAAGEWRGHQQAPSERRY
jgi:hypothetical protein